MGGYSSPFCRKLAGFVAGGRFAMAHWAAAQPESRYGGAGARQRPGRLYQTLRPLLDLNGPDVAHEGPCPLRLERRYQSRQMKALSPIVGKSPNRYLCLGNEQGTRWR